LDQGTVISAAGGFFTVYTTEGKSYHCRARGNLKRDNQSLLVGDRVMFINPDSAAEAASDEGIIEQLLPRSNCLSRPAVANVDQLVVIMSLREPPLDWQLVSRLLVLAEKEKIEALLCLNKADLVSEVEIEQLNTQLTPFPYQVLYSSTLNAKGLDTLAKVLNHKCSVFAGPSGAGKSSLLNALQPGLKLQTGQVSNRIKRGRHTTRQAKLLTLERGGSVVDTPGFTRLDFSGLKAEELSALFPEFAAHEGHCAFRNCQHLTEPNCAVRVNLGISINPLRYEHYKYFMEELNSRQEVY
jgi:ribosome biogenesis GTPase / thiamine phosphate phosphatase